MNLDKNYKGIDANLETSLEEYGFVARPITVDYPDEYFVIYKMGENEYGSGHIRVSELDAIVNGTEWASDDDINSMLETVGSSKEEWMSLPFESKFNDLISYWGTENVMGTDYYPNDKKWAFEEIGIDESEEDDTFEINSISELYDWEKSSEYPYARDMVAYFIFGDRDDNLIDKAIRGVYSKERADESKLSEIMLGYEYNWKENMEQLDVDTVEELGDLMDYYANGGESKIPTSRIQKKIIGKDIFYDDYQYIISDVKYAKNGATTLWDYSLYFEDEPNMVVILSQSEMYQLYKIGKVTLNYMADGSELIIKSIYEKTNDKINKIFKEIRTGFSEKELNEIIKNAKSQSNRYGYDYIVYTKNRELSFAKKSEFDRFYDKSDLKRIAIVRPNEKVIKYNYAKGGSVSTSELNDLIEKINASSGSEFSISGAYGNYELWAKDSNGGDNRIEVGSRKDIKEALIQNRYNKKYTKYAKGGETTTRTISYEDGGLAGLVDEEQMRDISFKIKVKTMPKEESIILHEVVEIEEYDAVGEKNVNLPKFHLIYGNNSLAIFDAFGVDEVAGLKREDAVEFIENLKKQGKTEKDGSFMAGLTNFSGDQIFMFFNVERLNFKGFANRVLPHEALHLSRYLISLYKNKWMRENLNTPNWWEDKRATFTELNDDNEEFFAETLERTTAIAMDGWFRATGSRCLADGGNIGLFEDGGGVEDKDDLEKLWIGYASAILFSENDSDTEEPLDSNYSISDFDKETVKSSKDLIRKFYIENKKAIKESGLDLDTIGNDIWYTRAGHGAGFFDHSLDQDIEDKLTNGAKALGEYPTVETYDGKISVRGGRVFDDYAKGGEIKEWENSMKKRKDIEFLRIEKKEALPNNRVMVYYAYNPIGKDEFKGTQISTDVIQFAKGGSVKSKAEKLFEERISYRWKNTDMGSGWLIKLDSPNDDETLEEELYLDIYDFDEDEYSFEDWKEDMLQTSKESFIDKFKNKYFDDFLEYIQRDKDDYYADGGGVEGTELKYFYVKGRNEDAPNSLKDTYSEFYSEEDLLDYLEKWRKNQKVSLNSITKVSMNGETKNVTNLYLNDYNIFDYADGGGVDGDYYAKGGGVGYNVFNYTDNIYATDEVFKTKTLANKFIKEFRNRFANQGYYRDNRMNKINIEDIDLLAIPSDFSPFKKFADGGDIENEFYIFEGIDHYSSTPLFRVESTSDSDAEYIGEWHTDRNDAEMELRELNGDSFNEDIYSNVDEELIRVSAEEIYNEQGFMNFRNLFLKLADTDERSGDIETANFRRALVKEYQEKQPRIK